MSKYGANRKYGIVAKVVNTDGIKRESKIASVGKSNELKTVNAGQDAMSGKVVGGFLVFGTPIKPKHVSRAKIAAAIDLLR